MYKFKGNLDVKGCLNNSFVKYTSYSTGTSKTDDFQRPWEEFKCGLLEVISSEYADTSVFVEVIDRLNVLVMQYLEDYHNNCICTLRNYFISSKVVFELPFIYEILCEIVKVNEDSYVIERIVDFCLDIRKNRIITNYDTGRLINAVCDYCEERLFDEIVDNDCYNNRAVNKMLDVASISFLEYFVRYANDFTSMLPVFGRIFQIIYSKDVPAWSVLEYIRERIKHYAYDTDCNIAKLIMDACAQSSEINKCIVAALSENIVSGRTLQKLSRHNESVVRLATAYNTSLDILTYERLAHDKVSEVKWRAINTLKEIAESDSTKKERREDAVTVLKRLSVFGYC